MEGMREVLSKINSQMHEGRCPESGCIGECAAIDQSSSGCYWAALYIWDNDFNDSTRVAKWFRDIGAEDVLISHVLYDSDNGDRDGRCFDGARAWHVEFRMARPNIDPEKEKAAHGVNVAAGIEPEPQTENGLTCRDTNDPQYWADRLRAADKGECERLLDAMFGLKYRMRVKGIPTPGANARCDEGVAIFEQRFGGGSTCRSEGRAECDDR